LQEKFTKFRYLFTKYPEPKNILSKQQVLSTSAKTTPRHVPKDNQSERRDMLIRLAGSTHHSMQLNEDIIKVKI
jgi:hypothetical protein